MENLETLFKGRKESLVKTCDTLARLKRNNIKAIGKCDVFVSSATAEAAFGDGFALFGRMRDAGEVIPEEFEHLDPNPTLKNEDRRVQPYIRSQLFIALVAELEDYFSSLLIRVLEAYPDKMRDRPTTLSEVLALGTIEALIAEAAKTEINGLFYKKPLEYRKRIEQILMMPSSVLEPRWLQFVELKARRDVGLHSNWQRNETYTRKLSEAGVSIGSDTFLGITRSYFKDALIVADDLIQNCNQHCRSRFSAID